MTFSISQSFSAVGPGITSSFLAIGGMEPYVYSVLPGGAGGSINSSTGVYTAPIILRSSPNQAYDVIQAKDAASSVISSRILIGSPLILLCDIIRNEMNLKEDRVYLWDQKTFQPHDYDPYIAISVPTCKPFGNINSYGGSTGGLLSNQAVNMLAHIDIDILSRGPAARDRKEEVILALNSNYSNSQQYANAFSIGRISTGFLNLSQVDGAAIPYRYKISCQMQYMYVKSKSVDYFDSFSNVSIVTNN